VLRGYARPILPAVVVATVALVLSAAPARAATPVAPASGSVFTTSDTATFTAQPDPDDGDYSFVFATTKADYDAGNVSSVEQDGDELELKLAWLAGAVDHIGTYWWGVCPIGPEQEIVAAGCSPAWSFALRFRLEDLTGTRARGDARYVMAQHFRSSWRGFSGRKVSCRRITRTRRRCHISGFAGDTVLDGMVTVYMKRWRSWSEPFFRARVRLVNEYCHVVTGRPLRECQTTRRKRGRLYG
jgi:hypothetical protein